MLKHLDPWPRWISWSSWDSNFTCCDFKPFLVVSRQRRGCRNVAFLDIYTTCTQLLQFHLKLVVKHVRELSFVCIPINHIYKNQSSKHHFWEQVTVCYISYPCYPTLSLRSSRVCHQTERLSSNGHAKVCNVSSAMPQLMDRICRWLLCSKEQKLGRWSMFDWNCLELS